VLRVALLLVGIAGLATAVASDPFSLYSPAVRDAYLQDLWTMARADRTAGRPLDAIELLQAILQQRPDLDRVRLELAFAAYEALDLEESRRQASRLESDPNLAAPLRKSVADLLERIAGKEAWLEQRHRWTPAAAVGLVYDDNLNAGPVSDLVEIDNELFFVTPDFQPKSDWGVVLRGSLGHRYHFPRTLYLQQRPMRLFWDSLGVVSRKAFLAKNDFDLDILGLRTGPQLEISGGHQASLALRGDYLRYGGEDYAFFTSLSPMLSWNLDVVNLTLELAWVNRNYLGTGYLGREGDYRSLGLQLDRSFADGRLHLMLGGRWSDEDTKDFSYSNSGYEVFGGIDFRQGRRVTWSASYRWRTLSYDGESNVFERPRDDDQVWLDIGVQVALPGTAFGQPALEAGYSLTRRQSTIPLYEYDRNQAYVALRLSF
jgi:hypothetical protein